MTVMKNMLVLSIFIFIIFSVMKILIYISLIFQNYYISYDIIVSSILFCSFLAIIYCSKKTIKYTLRKISIYLIFPLFILFSFVLSYNFKYSII
jgi:hypothetical protein